MRSLNLVAVDCAKLQLELLRLYKPQCLEILEMLRDVSADPLDHNDGDAVAIIESCDNDQNNGKVRIETLNVHETLSRKTALFMLKYIYYISDIGLTSTDTSICVSV